MTKTNSSFHIPRLYLPQERLYNGYLQEFRNNIGKFYKTLINRMHEFSGHIF